jgi:hypothetical protein
MSESGTKLVQISKLKSIADEVAVQKPCQFKLNLIDQSLSFACLTSIDYTDWILALTDCHDRILMDFHIDRSQYCSSDVDQSQEHIDDQSIKEQVVRVASHITF